MLALLNILTQYKMKKIPKRRYRRQLFLWLLILTVLICSFPFYNYLVGKPPLDSAELSLFDIVQTTAIIILFYETNSLRQKTERNEKTIRDLHQELSINLSTKEK